MTTLQERIQATWDTGDPLALRREVELLASEGHSQQSLEDALEALLLADRKAGASDATEEIINGVWDRLTGWRHADQHIGAHASPEKGRGAGIAVFRALKSLQSAPLMNFYVRPSVETLYTTNISRSRSMPQEPFESAEGEPGEPLLPAADELDELSPTIEGADEGDAPVKPPSEGVNIEKADRSLSELHRWYKSERLIIDPEWQRNYVWDNKRASKLIESFLMDIPVPVVYLARTDPGNYEVIDGVQRLTSVFKFIDGQYALSGLELMSEHNKAKFADLPTPLKSKLEDTTIRTFELSPKTSKNLLFIIFERLNTGGIALNEMEIRNCVYRGKLNDLIKRLSPYEPFVECVNQKNLSKRMTDRSLVLRFLAFYEKGYSKAQSGLKGFLNDFFDVYRNPPETKLEEFEKKFRNRSPHKSGAAARRCFS